MAKTSKTKVISKAKKSIPAKAAPAKKAVASVKVTLKGNKTTVKVAPSQKAPALKAKAIEITSGKSAKAAAPAPVIVQKAEKLDFVAGDFVVYPAHGVGQVEGVEIQNIAGMQVTLYTICFEKDRMRLKLPVSKVKASGLRKLSSKDRLKDALATLQGRSQVRRIMWSRRAQEYEAKINSGDPVSIAEVLRDLKKEGDQGEQSYSERQIYQAALARLAREVAAIEQIDEKKAAEKLEAVLGNVS
jgi:CarD family transcriptional regulator